MTAVRLAPTHVEFATPQRLRAFGDRPALFDGARITYRDLAGKVQERVDELGPRPTVVAVAQGRNADTIAWMLAALGGGHALLMFDERGAEILREYQPECVVRDGELRRSGRITAIHPELSLLLSTSGSTGSPKLVRLDANAIVSNATAIGEYLKLAADDCAITSLPLSYCYGLSVLTSHLAMGAAVVMTDKSVVDDCFWDLARTTGVTTLAGVPHTFDLLDEVGFDGRQTLPTLRRVTQAGGRMAPERVQEYARLAQRQAWDFYVMYGQTEATARMAYLPPHLALENPDCVGVAIPGGGLRIDDGEVVYSGPNVMMGYAHGPADLARGREITEVRTGDHGEFTADGLLRITGRAANRAKLFGLRIDLDHVESLVPGAVALVKDQTLVVVVQSEPGDLAADVAQRTGLPLCAVEVLRVRRLPRLSSGKVDRAALLARVRLRECEPLASTSGWGSTMINQMWNRHAVHTRTNRISKACRWLRIGPSAANPTRCGHEVQMGGDQGGTGAVKEALRTTLRCDAVSDDDTFVSLGGDSMAYVAASVRLERIVGELPRGWHLLTVQELAATAAPRRTRWSVVETSVALRAVAVLLVVASHATLIDVRGGAHLLLALAGFNFARFVLPSGQRGARMGRALVSFLAPAALWLGLVVTASQEYGLGVVGVTFSNREALDPAWRYWFVEVFAIALLLAALLAVPRGMVAWERRAPAAFAGVVLAATLIARELFTGATVPTSLFTVAASLWVFALGWLLGVLGHGRLARLSASLLVLFLVVPFFENPTRDIVVGLGLVLLLWVPTMRMPRAIANALAAIAAASLVIYLTHWQVYPPFDQWPMVATAVSLAVGVAGYWGLRRVGLMR